MAHLLVVDDEPSICELLEISFRKEGHKVEVASNGQAAKRRLASQVFDIVISDICMPDMDGVELLQYSKEVSPSSIFILITGVPTVDTAIDAVNFGADRYVIKGDRLLDELRPAVKRIAENQALKKEAGELRRQLRRFTGFDHIIGASEKMRSLFDLIETIAPQSSRVLITGESGTGKELVARAIHENSARAKAPFITINCGAFPETLLESELFGYLRGSFTGANENRRGLFQAADGGTLFMDEIGNMSLTMQVKLYRVLQEGKVRPLGSTEESDVDVRVIAATNKDFAKEIAEGRFREDLYYRLSVIPIHLPPLRERREDIPLLVRSFLDRYSKSMGKKIEGIEPEAMRRLEVYDWPGNVRELENTIERAVALEGSARISAEGLPARIREHFQETVSSHHSGNGNGSILPEGGINLEMHIQDLERSFLLAAMERSGGVRTRAADTLKMSYRSFRHYAKKVRNMTLSSVELPEPVAEHAAIPLPASKIRFRYGLTIFCGAFLLFQVQLILGKYILPWFGGTPAVWTTCMLFFQLLLLGGYLYAHLLSTKLNAKTQTVVHIAVLASSASMLVLGALAWKSPLLPGPSWRPSSSDFPIPQILRLLLVAVGLPFLCLSASGPLLQSWFGRTHPGKSPYRLYALSNIGSLLGLLTYPFLVEPGFRLHTQAWLWSVGYIVFFAGFIACAKDMNGPGVLAAAVAEPELEPASLPSRGVQLLWFLLPAMASLMLLATTNLMCQEVAVVPFLWVLPLGLYLLSFIICFDNPKWYRREIFQVLLGASFPMALIVLLSLDNAPIVRQVWMLSLVLFACCMVCHGELVRLKPHPKYLTRFYLLISAGGAAGGVFVALIAPQIFNGFWEFHWGLVGCALLAIVALARDRESWWYCNKTYTSSAILLGLLLMPEFISRRAGLAMIPVTMYRWHYYPVLTVLAVWVGFVTLRSGKKPPTYRRLNAAQLAALAVVAALSASLYAQVQFDKYLAIRRDRNFYAAVMLRRKGTGLKSIELRHGQTSHGYQLYDQPKQPTAYYTHNSGVALLLDGLAACHQPCPHRLGIIGMGVGTLALYAHPGDKMWFYEINPQVIAYSLAPNPYFTFIKDSSGEIVVVPGDARLSLEREFKESGSQNFDVLVVDAFSSDAIPVHLLTQEALEIYLEHLRGPDSVLVLHISNKMLDLSPVVAALAAHNHLAVARLHNRHSPDLGERSDWILLAKNPSALAYDSFRPHLDSMPAADPKLVWTDDYSDLFAVLRLR